ncbi:MAG: hypothetical protein CL873_02685 [Dehalococcoidales bacterium]|mgnify:CR=1 FL=1|jgi:heme/copper-type cytochrome/quinol oxidase subunit 2|nr:hypothetical protein [Dehalococcoidales bacterium]|tara:strand:- start:2497 stop:3078 length:582 start_codon:yes stop_codon:yes gene_type:complete
MEKEKQPQEVPQKRGRFYLVASLLIAITLLITTLFTGSIAYGIQNMVTEIKEGDLLPEGVREFRISVQQWYYNPVILKVNPGDRVRFILKSEDITHGFAINELGINLAVYAHSKSQQEVMIPPDVEEGIYTMYCSIFCGMGHPILKGKIIVGTPTLFIGIGMNKILPYVASTVMAGVFIAFIITGVTGRRETG